MRNGSLPDNLASVPKIRRGRAFASKSSALAFSTIVVIMGMGKRKASYRGCLLSFQLNLEDAGQPFKKADAIAKSKIQCIRGVSISSGEDKSKLRCSGNPFERPEACNSSQPIIMYCSRIRWRKPKTCFVKDGIREHFIPDARHSRSS